MTLRVAIVDAHPLFRVGLQVLPASRFSVLLDAAYVGYANTVSYGPAFDLGVSGVMVRTLVEIRL